MLNEPTIEKLQGDAARRAWPPPGASSSSKPDITSLGFDERFGCSSTPSGCARENKRLGRALKEAKLRLGAGVRRGHRLPAAPRARQGRHPPARDLPLGRASTRTSSSPARPAPARPTSRARSRSRRAARATARSTAAPRASSTSSRSRAPTAPTRACSRALARVDVLVLDDFASPPSRDDGAARPARDPRGPVRHALDDHHQPAAARAAGTTTSPTRPSPTPSATASLTTPTASC